MKRILVLCLALLLALGCALPAAAEVTAPGEFPIVEDTVTLKAFGCFPVNTGYTTDMANNWFTKYYEEKTNVHIEWEVNIGDGTDLMQKLQLKLASGSYPDIFLQTPIDRVLLYQSAMDGVFIGLNELIDTQTVYLKEIFDEDPAIRKQYTAPDGEIYGLGYITQYYHGSTPYKMWIYKPWLDALGLEVPQTTDEFYDTLLAFKEQDPNGNGQADEVPLLTNARTFLGASFIYSDGSNLMIEGDEIKFIANTEEYRDALRYLAKIYEAGLQPMDLFTMDSTQQIALMNGEYPAVGAIDTMHLSWLIPDLTAESIMFDYVPVPPLEGPTGLRQTAENPFISNPERFAITSSCENPEVAMRWVDWLYSFEGSAYSNYGDLVEADSEAPGWYYAPEGSVGADGNPALFGFRTVPSDDPNYIPNYSWNKQVAPWYQPEKWHTSMVQDPTNPNSMQERQIYDATTEYEPYKVNASAVFWNSPIFFMSEENNARIAEYQTIINNKVLQASAEFTTGVKSLDADWDAYVSELNALGLEEYMDLYNIEYKASLG